MQRSPRTAHGDAPTSNLLPSPPPSTIDRRIMCACQCVRRERDRDKAVTASTSVPPPADRTCSVRSQHATTTQTQHHQLPYPSWGLRKSVDSCISDALSRVPIERSKPTFPRYPSGNPIHPALGLGWRNPILGLDIQSRYGLVDELPKDKKKNTTFPMREDKVSLQSPLPPITPPSLSPSRGCGSARPRRKASGDGTPTGHHPGPTEPHHAEGLPSVVRPGLNFSFLSDPSISLSHTADKPCICILRRSYNDTKKPDANDNRHQRKYRYQTRTLQSSWGSRPDPETVQGQSSRHTPQPGGPARRTQLSAARFPLPGR